MISSDVLNITLSIAIVLITGFLISFLLAVTGLVHDAREVVQDLGKTAREVDGARRGIKLGVIRTVLSIIRTIRGR